ncbi:MAG: fumarylacetoacetate hydrolase [Pedosphaera sp.]|nr:fumarylacetoacetate hydrolase [Pedosphaera sp.]
MKLCRFVSPQSPWPCVGLLTRSDSVLDLSTVGVDSLAELLEKSDPVAEVTRMAARNPRTVPLVDVRLLAPIDQQEIWAAGVTYLQSKAARMQESEFSATAYDRVYDAPRPELFFKSLASKVVPPLGLVGIRRDAKWNVPEPELALVLNSRGQVAGYTAGNDMSSRDIEGENLLYLPQAKVYSRSCALGPFVTIGVTEADVRQWTVGVRIERAGSSVFRGETTVARIKRGFDELAGWLFRSQEFPCGAVLLTGTGVVPPDTFTLAEGDTVTVAISGIGDLRNSVCIV